MAALNWVALGEPLNLSELILYPKMGQWHPFQGCYGLVASISPVALGRPPADPAPWAEGSRKDTEPSSTGPRQDKSGATSQES